MDTDASTWVAKFAVCHRYCTINDLYGLDRRERAFPASRRDALRCALAHPRSTIADDGRRAVARTMADLSDTLRLCDARECAAIVSRATDAAKTLWRLTYFKSSEEAAHICRDPTLYDAATTLSFADPTVSVAGTTVYAATTVSVAAPTTTAAGGVGSEVSHTDNGADRHLVSRPCLTRH